MGFINQDTSAKLSINSKALVKGFMIALLASFILSLLLGGLLYVTDLSEGMVPSMALTSLGLSGFAGGWSSARIAGSSGLVHGTLTGVIFLFAGLIIFAWLLSGDFGWVTFIEKTLVTIIPASLGGIFGVTDR